MRRFLVYGRILLLAFIAATVVIPAALLLGLQHASGVSGVADAATMKTGVTAPRDSWFHMSLVTSRRRFHTATRALPPNLPDIKAAAGILVDIDTGEILWQVNPHLALPPASTTKELTALVALTNDDLNQLVTITPAALTQDWDETRMGLQAGERLTVRELLYGTLMVSGNDAATALAVDTVGMSRFVAAMNAQVAALGLHDSHFVTPVGLSDPMQYASPYDLAVIGATAIDRYPAFRQIVGTVDTDLAATPTHKDYPLHNLNQLLQKYPAAVGIKPGWTGDAGACMVGMAVRNGHRLVAVMLDAAYPAAEEARLFDWGFATEGLPPLLPPPTPSPTVTPHR